MRIAQMGRLMVMCGMMALLPGLQAFAAVDAYMTFENKAAAMKGEPSRASSPERIRLTSVARDAGSGMASGKRMHKPITIVREVDAASPMLRQAMTKGGTVGNVVIVFGGSGAGAGKVAQKVELTNAMVSSIKMVGTSEQITLDYESMVVTYTNGNKSATDDWESPK